MEIVESAEGARQIVFDEPEGSAEALQADLDEDAGRILDVVPRRLHEPGHLPQLRQDAPGAFGERRVVEEHLAREARREQIAIALRIALPCPDALQLE